MPPIIIAVVAAAAAYGGAAAAVAVGIAATMTAFSAVVAGALVGAVVAMGAGMLMQALSGKPSKPTVESTAADQRQMVRSSVAPRRVIYGRAKVSGPILYAASSGPDSQNLHLVVALAGHAIDAVETIWLEDTPIQVADLDGGQVVSGKYANKAAFGIHLGDQTEADGSLVAETPDGWDGDHRLLGIAYLHCRLVYDRDAYTGIPNISATVRGRNAIYDPRSGTTGYSTNWSLCVLDYLLSDFGLACSAGDEIDVDTFIAAANLSDEAVPLNAGGSVTQSRYTVNGTFTLDEAPIDIMEKLLSSGAGALVYVAGQYRLHGGAYISPSASLGPSDFAGPVDLQTMPPRSELFNGCRGTFIDPARFFQASDYPAIQDPTSLAADGEEVWRELNFAFVDDATRAQRLARQTLYRMRSPLTLRAPVRYASLQFCVWQTIAVTLPDFGWVAKPFRISAFSFNPADGTCNLTLTEEQVAAYAWLYDAAISVPDNPNTTLVDPLTIPAPTSVVAVPSTAIQADGTIAPALDVSWVGAANPFVNAHEVQWQIAGGEWLSRDVAMPTLFAVLEPVVSGQAYSVRVRGVTGLARGQWSSVATPTAGADVTPPSVPGSLATAGVLRGVAVSWTLPTERDLSAIEVYEGATNLAGARVLIGETKASVYLRTGLPADTTRYYWVRSRDRSGNVSAFAGPVAGTSSYLLADDIQDGIINTAKFASTIKPVEIITGTASTAAENTVAVNTVDGKLYTYKGGAWRMTVQPLGPSGTLTDAQINDLDGAKLLDNSIVAAKLTAGSVTTSKLSVGNGNVIWNSCCTLTTDGWVKGNYGSVSSSMLVSSRPSGATTYALDGVGSGYLRVPTVSVASGSGVLVDWRPDGSGSVHSLTCEAGQRIQARGLLGTNRCVGYIQIVFFDSSHSYISLTASTATSSLGGGIQESSWSSHSVIATAPTGAAYALLRIVLEGNGGSDPYLFFTKTMISKAPVNATEVGEWAPGGVTEISGGQLRTNSVTAEQVDTASLFADSGTFNDLKAGIASFGGLTATQIATGELRAYHMAAEEIISDSIQVRNLIVGTTKITGNAVTDIQLATQFNNTTLHVYDSNFLSGFNKATLVGISVTVPSGADGKVMITCTPAISSAMQIQAGTDGGSYGGE